MRPVLLLCALCALLAAAPAAAQTRSRPRDPGRTTIELSAGVSWTGGFDAGGADALLTRNPGTGSAPLTLFTTSSRMQPAPGLTARAALFLTRALAVEGVVDYSRPKLATRVAGDFEGAASAEAHTTVASYLFGGSILYHFHGRRVSPFVDAGAGRTRQLDAGHVLVVTGNELHAGGGVKYLPAKRVGLPADPVVSSRDRSMAFDARRHTVAMASASLICRF